MDNWISEFSEQEFQQLIAKKLKEEEEEVEEEE